MLEDAKELYETSARLYIEDWKSRDKNDLIREAVDNFGTYKYDSYVSAIMLKYWAKMIAYYHKCKLVISPEDAHMWLTQAVLYAVEKHPWTNPNSSIYNDINGPDKVVNRVLESKRLTFYQQLNRYNRKINSALLSLESLTEDLLDAVTPIYRDDTTFEIDEFIVNLFKHKHYFEAFLIDAIVHQRYSVTQPKKLVTHLRCLDTYCDIFALRYELNINRVKRASTYITRLCRASIKHKISTSLVDLKRMICNDEGAINSGDTKAQPLNINTPNTASNGKYVDLW